jgi:hypothetical protein
MTRPERPTSAVYAFENGALTTYPSNLAVVREGDVFGLRLDLTGEQPTLTVKLLALLGTFDDFAIRQCSYCKCVLGIKTCRGGGVTHGVCPKCLTDVLERA